MLRRKGRTYFTAEEVEYLLRVKDERITDLSLLLNEERVRVEGLLTRVLGPRPSYAYPEPNAVPEPNWNWPAIQPEDEAIADVRSLVGSDELGAREAEEILELLGFPNTDVETYS